MSTGFNWGDLWAPLITSGTQLAGGLLVNSLNNDKERDARKQAEGDRAFAAQQSALDFERQKELAAFKAGLGGGSAPTPFLGFTDPQRVQAIQEQDRNNLAAIQQLIAAYQRGLGR